MADDSESSMSGSEIDYQDARSSQDIDDVNSNLEDSLGHKGDIDRERDCLVKDSSPNTSPTHTSTPPGDQATQHGNTPLDTFSPQEANTHDASSPAPSIIPISSPSSPVTDSQTKTSTTQPAIALAKTPESSSTKRRDIPAIAGQDMRNARDENYPASMDTRTLAGTAQFVLPLGLDLLTFVYSYSIKSRGIRKRKTSGFSYSRY